MSKRFLVTGAGGFVGSHVVDQLLKNPQYEVIGTIRSDNDWVTARRNKKRLNLVRFDMTDREAVEQLFKKWATKDTIVIHTAGLISIENRIKPVVYETNVRGTQNIIDACIKFKVKRLVYTSSVHAMKEAEKGQTMKEAHKFHPDWVVGGYAKSKAIATQNMVNARKTGLDVVIVFPSGITGPGEYGDGNFKQVMLDYLNGDMITYLAGGYNFVDVRDVADGTIAAAITPKAKNQNYLLTNQFLEIKKLIELLDQIYPDRQRKLSKMPRWLAYIVADLSELWSKLRGVPPTFTRYAVHVLNSNGEFDYTKAKNELDYHPRPITKTIREAVAWYEKVGLLK